MNFKNYVADLIGAKNKANQNDTSATKELAKTEAKRTAIKIAAKIGFGKIALIIGAIVLFLLIFIVLIVAIITLLSGDSSASDEGLSGSYGNSTNYWWPIGSNETTTVDGNLFAAGDPVEARISSPFGPRNIGGNHSKNHKGIDIAGCSEAYVIASKSGEVVDVAKNCVKGDSSCGGGYGNRIYIEHEDGSITRYAHLLEDSIVVSVGDKVGQGQVIAQVGNTGSSTGPHLHFEIRINGDAVDPQLYVSMENPRPSYQEIDQGETVEGNSNQQTICLTMKSAEYTDVAVAAILTNMKFESSFDPEAKNELDCLGVTQWCFGRATALKNTYGSSWNVLANQLEYVKSELSSSSYIKIKNYINASSSVSDSTYYYCMHYEIPGKSACAKRKNSDYNSKYLTYVQNGCS